MANREIDKHLDQQTAGGRRLQTCVGLPPSRWATASRARDTVERLAELFGARTEATLALPLRPPVPIAG